MAPALITMCMYFAALNRMYVNHQDTPQAQAEIGAVIQDAQKKCEVEKKADEKPAKKTK